MRRAKGKIEVEIHRTRPKVEVEIVKCVKCECPKCKQ